MPELLNVLPLVGIVLVFWLFVIRPARLRQRNLAAMQDSLTVGAEVILTSGIIGTVRSLHDDEVGLEVAPGMTIRVARGAVGGLTGPGHDSPRVAADAAEEN